MRIPTLSFALLLLCLPAVLCAQRAVRDYSFPGKYKGRSAQGMAIHGDAAFLLNNFGYCRIYDLKNKKMLAEFELASAGEGNHSNCAEFGVEFPKGNTLFPALYVSECWPPRRCFVESIDGKSVRLIQTIQFKEKGTPKGTNWFVDKGQKCLYAIGGASGEIDDKGTRKYHITKLPLPSLDKKKVAFTEKDILDRFEIQFANLMQGGTIRGDCLYLPVGLYDAPDRKDTNRAVIIVNLKTRKIEKTIDLNADIPEEPEDAAFYNGFLHIYCGQKGGLYRVPEIKSPAP